MTAAAAEPGAVAFFCLVSGAVLGGLFLAVQSLTGLLGAGRLLTAAGDLLFCIVCAAGVFLCALAVDHGRLRLAQIVLQALGAWAAVTALGPWSRRLRRWGRARARKRRADREERRARRKIRVKKPANLEKKRKNPQKTLEKIMSPRL